MKIKRNLPLIGLILAWGLFSGCAEKREETEVQVAQPTTQQAYNPQTGTFNNNCGTPIGEPCDLGLPQGATCESYPGYQTYAYDPSKCIAISDASQQQYQQYQQYPQQGYQQPYGAYQQYPQQQFQQYPQQGYQQYPQYY